MTDKIFLDYQLPGEYIAQRPSRKREEARLLFLNRQTKTVADGRFTDFTRYLEKGDVIVLNDTRVVPSRVRACKADSRGKVEILFLSWGSDTWTGLIRGRLKKGAFLKIEGWDEPLEVVSCSRSTVKIKAPVSENPLRFFDLVGTMPLPPYIERKGGDRGIEEEDKERYQTVFAREKGSVAAPTAGLHFSRALLEKIEAKGVDIVYVTLHIGWGTFRPIRGNYLRHQMGREWGRLSEDGANKINEALSLGHRILAVGTTTVRLLESRGRKSGRVSSGQGWVDLYITPGYDFKIVGALLTNFHIPHSTLLLLVNAFAGPALTEKAYHHACRSKYRFYSYGDAMLIL